MCIRDRDADVSGLNTWTGKLIAGNGGAEIVKDLVMSEEFRNLNKSDAEFVDILYAVSYTHLHYAKNRTVFMKKYAKWYHMISYYLIFIHVFTIYYIAEALLNGRKDIAKAWWKGTRDGLKIDVTKNIKIKV